jgi:dynein heavy chain
MLPPIGGRNVISLRYQRHYNLLYVEPFERDSLFLIFTNVLDWYFKKEQISMSAITSLKDKVVDSTIDLYFSIQNSKELLPTPAKSHYTYNLRDISKVFQGIAKSSNKAFEKDNDFVKLWAHECMRVFKDRLINDQDQTFFDKMLKDLISNNLKREWTDLVQIQPLLWSDFVPTIAKSKDDPTKKIPNVYCELVNREDLKKVSYEKLGEYNNFYSANKMNLVLFDSAI